MLDASERAAALLRAADRLGRWAEDLPRWRMDSTEPWWEFLDRRYVAETRLIAGLREAPQCQLAVCPSRVRVELSVAGFRVRTSEGRAAALLEWASLVRARSGG